MKRIRQPIIAVLGHVDHGKCLMPDERVLLPGIGSVELEKLFERSGEVVHRDSEKEIRRLELPFRGGPFPAARLVSCRGGRTSGASGTGGGRCSG